MRTPLVSREMTAAPGGALRPTPAMPFGAAGLLLSSLLAAAPLAGCTVDDGSDTPQGPGQSYSSYLDEVTTAVLAYEQGCGLLDASRSEARRAMLRATVPSYLIEVKDGSAKAGRTSYSSACVRVALQGAACSATRVPEVLAACDGKEASGRLAFDRVCRTHDECKDGYCKGVPLADRCGVGKCGPRGGLGAACPEGPRACDPAGFACQDGACFPRGGAGATCRDDRNCQDGLRCLRPSQNAVEGTCGQPVAGAPGAECDLLEVLGKGCATGYACYKDSNSIYRCQPIIPVGQSCRYSEACAQPATCVLMPNQMTGTCRALGKPGDPCDLARGAACQLTTRCYALDQNAQAVCTPLPQGNERCDGDRLPCLVGTCSNAAMGSTCRPLAGAGLACAQNSECASNLCDTATRTCKTPSCG